MKNFRLDKIQPNHWGAIYLLLIPFYAVIYHWCLPKQFYHSTVTLETVLNKDKEVLKDIIREEIISNHKFHFDKTVSVINNNYFDINEIEIHDIKGNSNSVKFDFFLPTYGIQEKDSVFEADGMKFKLEKGAEMMQPMAATVNISDEFCTEALDTLTDNPVFIYKYIEYSKINFNYDSTMIDQIFWNDEIHIQGRSIMMFRKKAWEKLESFINTMNGIPSDMSGNYWRMFYFSSMTITTVGFGDIVPLTTLARLIVASEAILGIIIIGLFLNSIASKLTKK